MFFGNPYLRLNGNTEEKFILKEKLNVDCCLSTERFGHDRPAHPIGVLSCPQI